MDREIFRTQEQFIFGNLCITAVSIKTKMITQESCLLIISKMGSTAPVYKHWSIFLHTSIHDVRLAALPLTLVNINDNELPGPHSNVSG